MEEHVAVDIHTAVCGGTYSRAAPQGAVAHGGPMLEQFLKDCKPWEGPMLDRGEV